MDATSRNKIYVQNSSGNIPKPVVAFFMTVQTVIGIDSGFSHAFAGKLSTFLNRYSIFISVVISGILLSTTRWLYSDTTWYCSCTTKFIIYVLASRLLKYKIYDFFKEFHNNPEKIRIIEKGYCGFGMIVYVFLIFITRFLVDFIRCRVNPQIFCKDMNKIYHSLIIFGIHASDVVGAFMIPIIFYVYAFLVHMKKSFLANLNIKNLEQHYIFLANSYERITIIYNSIVIVELFTNTPRFMVTLWTMLKYIKENGEWFTYTSEFLYAFHPIIQMCIPAVIAEMVNYQVDAIKLILNEQRRVENDQAKLYEITRVLRYIKGRKLQNDLWRVIPVDLRLPLALLSVCTTYFIVILQFTHLYD